MAIITYTLIALLPVAVLLLPYLADSRKLRRFPSSPLGALSNLWLFYQARMGRRHFAVHDLHEKHGKFVRIQPDHISIADPDALSIVYGHGTGFLKS